MIFSDRRASVAPASIDCFMTARILVAAFAASLLPLAPALAELRDIRFPVDGSVAYRDDFGEPRNGGRTHEGIDMLGEKMMPLVSAVDGRVSYVVVPEASWGYAVVIEDADGWTYHYLHMNNDTPGTDDGNGGPENAYASGISRGARVVRGQLLGWMGDSGNAEWTSPHLHFEIRRPDGEPVDPYESLNAAERPGGYAPEGALAKNPTINADKRLLPPEDGIVYCVSGSLIKTPSSTAVYYCGRDGKRYVFPHFSVYDTWYTDFSGVQTMTDVELAGIPIGGNVTYRPGSALVKVQTDPKVYAVDSGGTLRWVTTAEIAASLYGADWAGKVRDVSDAFFVNYRIGEPITAAF